jgi:hypothetical protein
MASRFPRRRRLPANGRRPTEVRSEQRVEFLGEQAGPVEDKLKEALARELARFPEVTRAYLARVGFQPENKTSVALCVRSSGENTDAIVKRVGARFAELFDKTVFLDVLFLTAQQEVDLDRVCTAFYPTTV